MNELPGSLPQEPFEIRILESTSVAVPFKLPHLPHGRFRVHGDPAQERVRVILSQRAYQQVNAHAQTEPQREVGGVLLGEVYQHEGVTYVEVREILRATQTQSGPTHMAFTPDTWAEINRQRELLFGDLAIVGWYHTHPQMGVFFSADDQFVHRNFFQQPWHVALVVEPHKHLGCFFVTDNAAARMAGGFYELFDVQNKSVVTWGNLPQSSATTVIRGNHLRMLALVLGSCFLAGLAFATMWSMIAVQGLRRDVTEARGTAQAVEAVVQSLSAASAAETVRAARTAEAAAIVAAVRTSDAEATVTASALQATQAALSAQSTARAVQEATAIAAASRTRATVATPTPTVVKPTLAGQWLAIRQEGQVVGADVIVQRGLPVTFTFTVQDLADTAAEIARVGITLEREKQEQFVPLPEGALLPRTLGEAQIFTLTHSFELTGTYTVSIAIQVVGREDVFKAVDTAGRPDQIVLRVE